MLSGIPLAGSTGLGEWAANGLREGLEAVGLEPADTAPLKPVLAGTEAVARAGGGDWSAGTSLCASRHWRAPRPPSDALGLLAERVSDEAYQRLASLEITLAVVEIPLTGVSVPLTVTLPATLAEGATRTCRWRFRSPGATSSALRRISRDGSELWTFCERRRGDAPGQATVELAVVLPVAIVLAVIVVNALSFFEACAAFDQLGPSSHLRLCSVARMRARGRPRWPLLWKASWRGLWVLPTWQSR